MTEVYCCVGCVVSQGLRSATFCLPLQVTWTLLLRSVTTAQLRPNTLPLPSVFPLPGCSLPVFPHFNSSCPLRQNSPLPSRKHGLYFLSSPYERSLLSFIPLWSLTMCSLRYKCINNYATHFLACALFAQMWILCNGFGFLLAQGIFYLDIIIVLLIQWITCNLN